jgi:hypothetical protein
METQMRRKTMRCDALLLGALALALCHAQEPTLVRLSDAVGNTIDLPERDSFSLFPNTIGFQHAVILALPGPRYFADVTLADTTETLHVFLRILPGQLERIRFLIDDRQSVAKQLERDSSAASAIADFWQEVEGRPLQSLAVEPSGPTDASKPQLQPRTRASRYIYTLHGATLGSLAGGYVGSRTSIKYVGTGQGCLPDFGGLPFNSTPWYSVNHPAFWTAACGLTALGSAAGYVIGDQLDRKTLPSPTTTPRGSLWRRRCEGCSGGLGAILGTAFFLYVGGRYYGETELLPLVENDPYWLTLLPAALTGVCIAVEVTTIGHHIVRAIDRRNAHRAAGKRRALEPARSEHGSLRTGKEYERTDRTPRRSGTEENRNEEDIPTH